MNTNSNDTEKLMQKIVDRQVELTVLSDSILKNKTKKQHNVNYVRFQEVKNKNNVFNLSKAV